MLLPYGDNTIIGTGEYLAGDDAESMAWLSCMFNEMGFRVCNPLPGDHTDEEMGTPVFVLPIDRKEFGL